jgi:uncharacterized glyoxalase superfamily protein PhnB
MFRRNPPATPAAERRPPMEPKEQSAMTQCDQPNQFPNSVHLAVESVKKSIKFYREKLGFELRNCFPDEKKPVWASLVLGGQVVMVGAAPSPEVMKKFGASKDEIDLAKKDGKAFAKRPHGVGVHVYLLVPDVDALAKSLKKKKATIVMPPKTQFYGIRELMIEDLDGYRLVLYTPVPGAAGQHGEGACAAAVEPEPAGAAT